jgi:hypothetical protein
LLRIEAQLASLLITVRHNPDITTVSAERVASFTEVEPALAEVRSFLERFAEVSRGRGSKPAQEGDQARPPG